MDLRHSVISVAAIILDELNEKIGLPLSELDDIVQNRLGEDARFNFVSALNFLFLAGKLEYDGDADTVILNESN